MKNLKFIFISSVFLNAQNGNTQNGNTQNGNTQNGNAQNGNAQNGNAQETMSFLSLNSNLEVVNDVPNFELVSLDSKGQPIVPPLNRQNDRFCVGPQNHQNGQFVAAPQSHQNGRFVAAPQSHQNGRFVAAPQGHQNGRFVQDNFCEMWMRYIAKIKSLLDKSLLESGSFNEDRLFDEYLHVYGLALTQGEFCLICEAFEEERFLVCDDFGPFFKMNDVHDGNQLSRGFCSVIGRLRELSALVAQGAILDPIRAKGFDLHSLINDIWNLSYHSSQELALFLNVAGFCVNCLNENGLSVTALSYDVFFVHKWLKFCCEIGRRIPFGNARDNFQNQLEYIILKFSKFLNLEARGVYNSGIDIVREDFMQYLSVFMYKTLCVFCGDDLGVRVCLCSVADQASWFPQYCGKPIYLFQNGACEDPCVGLFNGIRISGPFKDDVNDLNRCFWMVLHYNGEKILLALGGGPRTPAANVYDGKCQYPVVLRSNNQGMLSLGTNDTLPIVPFANNEMSCGCVCLGTNNSDYDLDGFWNRMGRYGHYLWLACFSVGLLGAIVCDPWFLSNWHGGHSRDIVLQSFGGVFTWIFGGSVGFGLSCVSTIVRVFFGEMGQKVSRYYYESNGLDASKGRIVKWFRGDRQGIQEPRLTCFDCSKKGVAFYVLLVLTVAGMISTLGVFIAWLLGASKFTYSQDFAMGFFLFVGGLLLGVFAGYVFNYFREKSIWTYDNQSRGGVNLHEPVEEMPQLPLSEPFASV